MLKQAIPVIHISDSVKAEEFYCKGLGFKLVSSWRPDGTNKDPCYMALVRDGAHLHLTSFKDGVVGTWTLRCMCLSKMLTPSMRNWSGRPYLRRIARSIRAGELAK
jgi:hypothetical protein